MKATIAEGNHWVCISIIYKLVKLKFIFKPYCIHTKIILLKWGFFDIGPWALGKNLFWKKNHFAYLQIVCSIIFISFKTPYKYVFVYNFWTVRASSIKKLFWEYNQRKIYQNMGQHWYRKHFGSCGHGHFFEKITIIDYFY